MQGPVSIRRLALSLVYMVAGFIILGVHAGWWVAASAFLLLDLPMLALVRYLRRG